MNEALTFRVLAGLPAAEQAKIRALAAMFGDLDDLVQNAWLAALEAKRGGLAQVKRGDTVRTLADRARCRTRRENTQDPAFYGRGLDGIAETAADATRSRKRREITREVTADFGVTPRRARQIVARQLQRAQQGDLFFDGGSGTGKGGV